MSRPTGELHFICSKDELHEGVSFGQARPTFDLCSDIQGEHGPDYFCFNSDSDAQGKDDHVIEYITESESDGLANQRDNVDVEQTPVDQESDDVQQPVKDNSESEESDSETPPPLRTRRGRVIKKPIKFGFEE